LKDSWWEDDEPEDKIPGVPLEETRAPKRGRPAKYGKPMKDLTPEERASLEKQRLEGRLPKVGRPKFETNLEHAKKIRVMAACGIAEKHMAKILDISPAQLKRYYRDELALGSDEANMQVALSVFEMATEHKNYNAAKLWLASKAGWKETSRMELTGRDGKDLTDIERTQRLAAIMAGKPELFKLKAKTGETTKDKPVH